MSWFCSVWFEGRIRQILGTFKVPVPASFPVTFQPFRILILIFWAVCRGKKYWYLGEYALRILQSVDRACWTFLTISQVTVWPTNFMEHISSWKSVNALTNREICCILWNQKFNYNVHNRPPHFLILRKINPVHALRSVSLRSVLILSFYLRLGLRYVAFIHFFFQQSPVCVPLLPHKVSYVILPDLMTRIIFDEQCKTWHFSLRKFSPSFSYFFSTPNIFLSILFSITCSLCFFFP